MLWRVLLVAGAACALGRAQPEEISADRPDFTESTDTVGRGTVQFEGGWLWTSHSLQEGLSETMTVPQGLLRIGLARRAELRLASDGLVRESAYRNGLWEHNLGGADLAIGAKIVLSEEHRFLPALSVIGALSLPVGSDRFSSGGRDPFVKLCWDKALPEGFDAGGNVNVRLYTFGPGTSVEGAVSLSVGHRLWGGLHGFWEVYRISPIAGDEAAHAIADTGLSRLLGKNAEIDVAVGHTLNARTPSWFVGVGFAMRRNFRRAAGLKLSAD